MEFDVGACAVEERPPAELILARLACWANRWGDVRCHAAAMRSGYEAAMNDLGKILRDATPHEDWLDIWRSEGWGISAEAGVLAAPYTTADYARVQARNDEIYGMETL